MTFDIFLEQIPELGNTSASQLICFFGYYIIDIQKKESFFPKDIDNCFQMAQISPYSNIPSFLSTKSKGKNSIFIKNKNGSYTLQRKLREEINVKIGLPKKTVPSNNLFPTELLIDTRGYIQNIASQAILCYDYGLYDASLVMMRKLIETLIIELFEFEGISEKIKNKDDYFLYLSDLIDKLQSEKKWNLSRNTQQSLPNIKKYGDLSAHNRRFSAKKTEMEKLKYDLRIVIEELVHLIDYPSRK